MSQVNERATRLLDRARTASAAAGRWMLSQLGQTFDRSAWSSASSWRQRLAAVSWPRAGLLTAAVVSPLLATYVIHLATRPVAYPPPEPSEESIALYAKTAREVRPAPPPGLVEANKTWTGES